ncbi:hypothetical protein FVE85_4945 [Porphyridium purpureum]|uniref:Uncharacterized protein n=1 Tax=Porphyridium purpureum TaxID=35688 RepID=A0A5J4YRA4_PORPP|nr:hypothetical protein FVE85_4945 [Porphyridium purpureum]|eukprot:POR1791..scf236_6
MVLRWLRSRESAAAARDLLRLLRAHESGESHGAGTGSSPPLSPRTARLSGLLKAEMRAVSSAVVLSPRKNQMGALEKLAGMSLGASAAEMDAAAFALLAGHEEVSPLLFALHAVKKDAALALKCVELIALICSAGPERDTQNAVRDNGLLKRLCVAMGVVTHLNDKAMPVDDRMYAVRCFILTAQVLSAREANRDFFIEHDVPSMLGAVMASTDPSAHAEMLAEMCLAISNISFGSDKRKIDVAKHTLGPVGTLLQRSQALQTPDLDRVRDACCLVLRNLAYECESNQARIASEHDGKVLAALIVEADRLSSSQFDTSVMKTEILDAQHQSMVALQNISVSKAEVRDAICKAGGTRVCLDLLKFCDAKLCKPAPAAPPFSSLVKIVDDAVKLLRNIVPRNTSAQAEVGSTLGIAVIYRAVAKLCAGDLPSIHTKDAFPAGAAVTRSLVDASAPLFRYLAFPELNRTQIHECGALEGLLIGALVKRSECALGESPPFLEGSRAAEDVILAIGNSCFGLAEAKETAGRHGALEAVISVCSTQSDSEMVVIACLRTLRCLVDGVEINRRLAVSAGAIQLAVDMMRKHPSEVSLQEQALAMLLNLSLSDGNLIMFSQLGVQDVTVYALQQHAKHRGIHLHGALLLSRMNGAPASDVQINRENIEFHGLKTKSSALKASAFANV